MWNMRSKQGRAVIPNAAQSGCSGKLKLLIEAGADVNATGPYRTTALLEVVFVHYWVAKNENYYKDVEIFNCVQVLLKSGANVNQLNRSLKNALKLHLAYCDHISEKQAKLLYVAG